MKTLAACAAAFVLVLLLSYHVAPAQTLSASLGWGTFVQGMDSVVNVFTLENPPAGTDGVLLLFYKDDPSHPITVRIDFKPGNKLVQGVDMGQLEPGSKVQAVCQDAVGVPLGMTPEYDISILSEPSWLKNARLSNVQVSAKSVRLQADYDIDAGLDSIVPRWVAGIGGRSYSMLRSSVRMDITYNFDTRVSAIGSGTLMMGVGLFGQRSALRGIGLPSTSITLDQDFNLRVKAADSLYSMLFAIDIPLFYLPLPFFADLRFDASAIVFGVMKGAVVVGNENGAWGFVRDGQDVTSLTAKLTGIGSVRGEFNVLGGLLASVEGRLSVYGELGGGVEYVSVPTSQTTTAFGGNISVTGELRATALLFFEVAHLGPKVLYDRSFGRMPGRIVATNNRPFIKATTVLVDSTLPMPRYAPQPAIAQHNGDIGVAWLDSLNGHAGLWLAVKDHGMERFDTPKLIASNEHGIGAPTVALLPEGSAIVAWTQNRYTPATFPSGAGLREALAAQDVYVAFRDNVANTISLPMMMADDTSTLRSGRAEADPRICALDEGNAMLIWLGQDSPGTSRVYYAPLKHTDGTLHATSPAPIPGITGMNRNPQVAALDGGRALAVWTNDPDGLDSTYDMRVMSAVWDGSSWSVPAEVARAGDRESFTATTLAAGHDRAVLGWIASANDTNGAIVNTLQVRSWDDAASRWRESDSYAMRDTSAYLQNPTASVGPAGQAVIAWQRVPFNDTVQQGEGARGLLMRDLNVSDGAWRIAAGLPFLSDTTAYVWNAQTAFGASDDLHTLTEEQPRDGSTMVPAGGVRFGSDERGLVWRSIRVSPDLTVSDREEPQTPVSGVKDEPGAALASLEIWPNPTHGDFTVTYSLRSAEPVTVEIVDVMGRTIEKVLDAQVLGAGTYQTHVSGDRLMSGIYWVVIRSGRYIKKSTVLIAK